MGRIETDRAIRIHGIAQARAAMAAAAGLGLPVLLASAPDAGRHAGAGWFRALVARLRAEYPDVVLTAILDCGDSPGATLAALREGVGDVALAGPPAVVARLAEIATAHGARLHPPIQTAFESGEGPDAVRAYREWLMGNTEVRSPGVANPDIPGY